MIQQIPTHEYSGSGLTEGACVCFTPATLILDPPINWEDYVEAGLGLVRDALFKISDEHFFALQYFESSPRNDWIIICVQAGDIGLEVDAVLTELQLTSHDLGWLTEGAVLPAMRVIRQDDNGAQFTVGEYACRADAMAAIRKLEQAVHKQGYFIERIC